MSNKFEGDEIFKSILKKLDYSNCYNRASEYFLLSFREVKIIHFPKSVAKSTYMFMTNQNVQKTMVAISWCYLGLTFFEPSHSTTIGLRYSTDSFYYRGTIIAELFILFVMLIHDTLLIYQRITAIVLTKKNSFDKRSVFSIILTGILIIDFIVYYSLLNVIPYFRVGRLARPLKVIFTSSDVSRTVRAILNIIP